MSFLITSLVASVALTVLANVGLRMLSRRSDGGRARRIAPGRGTSMPSGVGRARMNARVFFPWKLMLAGSIIANLAIQWLG